MLSKRGVAAEAFWRYSAPIRIGGISSVYGERSPAALQLRPQGNVLKDLFVQPQPRHEGASAPRSPAQVPSNRLARSVFIPPVFLAPAVETLFGDSRMPSMRTSSGLVRRSPSPSGQIAILPPIDRYLIQVGVASQRPCLRGSSSVAERQLPILKSDVLSVNLAVLRTHLKRLKNTISSATQWFLK